MNHQALSTSPTKSRPLRLSSALYSIKEDSPEKLSTETPRYMMPRKNDSSRQSPPSSVKQKPLPMTFAVDQKAASTIFANEKRSTKKRPSVLQSENLPETPQYIRNTGELPRYMMPRKIDSTRVVPTIPSSSSSPLRPRPMTFATKRSISSSSSISSLPHGSSTSSTRTPSPVKNISRQLSDSINVKDIADRLDTIGLSGRENSPTTAIESGSLKKEESIHVTEDRNNNIYVTSQDTVAINNTSSSLPPPPTITSPPPPPLESIPASSVRSPIDIMSSSAVVATVTTPKPVATDQLLAQYKANILSENIESHLPATKGLRRLLSAERNPPIDLVIRSGLVPVLVTFLEREENPTLQFEAAWALSNVASGSSLHTQAVIDAGAVPHFIRLLVSPYADVREQTAWALGNIAGDSIQARDFVLSSAVVAGAVEGHKLNLVNTTPPTQTILCTQSWMISNLCSGKPAPSLAILLPVLPLLATLIQSDDPEVLVNVCYSLSHLTGSEEWIQPVLDAGVAPKVIKLLESDHQATHDAAVRTVGNIMLGNDGQTQTMIQLQVLPVLVRLLDHQRVKTRKEVCWTLSNITAGTPDQIQSVIDAGAMPKFFQLIEDDAATTTTVETEFGVHKEVLWAVCNAITQGTAQQQVYMIKLGGIKAICSFLKSSDKQVLLVVLEAIQTILQLQTTRLTATSTSPSTSTITSNTTSQVMDAISLFKECSGDMKVKALIYCSHEERVREISMEIIHKYFSSTP